MFLPLQYSSWKIMIQPQWHSSPPRSIFAARQVKSKNKIKCYYRAIDLLLPKKSECRCHSWQSAKLPQPMQSSVQSNEKQPYQIFSQLKGGGREVSFRTNRTIKAVRFPNKTKLGWHLQVHTPWKYKLHFKKKIAFKHQIYLPSNIMESDFIT